MSYQPQQELMKTPYGELLSAEKTPLVQISARYGVSSELLTPTLGGTAEFSNNMFVASTGTGASNVAAVISSRESAQRAGQGLSCEMSSVFTEGVANSTQEAGFISSESAIAFGYNGSEYGVVIASGGQLENQDLTIGGDSTFDQFVDITVDGTLYANILIEAGPIEDAAYQMAEYLNANEPRYRFFSNGDVVTALARLPDFGGGSWAFSGAGLITGSWTEIKNGSLPTESWTPKDQWSEYPDIDIDPTTYNEYKIQVDANIEFYIKDNQTGEYELVHVHQHLGSGTSPLIGNPTFRVGWACRNTGNTTDISVSGFFASAFVEGKLIYTQPTTAISNRQVSVTTTLTNIISFRNRAVYQGAANRAEIIPSALTFSTDATKPVIFEIWANPETSTYLDWEYLDEANSLMEIATNAAPITGGQLVGTSSSPIDIKELIKFQSPTASFSIAAKAPTATADMTASGTWIEDK